MPHLETAVGPRAVAVVEVTGEDRQTYLDAVLTQRLRDATPGTATSALELGPHGEPMGVLDVLVEPDRLVLLVPDDQPHDVVGRLRGRTFLADAVFTPLEDHVVLRVRGAGAHGAVAAAGVEVTVGRTVTRPDGIWAAFPHGVDVVVTTTARPAVEAALAAAGVTPADATTLDDAEVAAGLPRAPEEIAHGRLPEELGLLPTHVHLDKGCYPGQEAVARMWMLGRPRRRLARVTVDPQVQVGTLGEGRGAVEVTRLTATAAGGSRSGLAFVPPDAAVGEQPVPGVTVEGFVGEGLPVPGHDPAMTRRRDRAS